MVASPSMMPTMSAYDIFCFSSSHTKDNKNVVKKKMNNVSVRSIALCMIRLGQTAAKKPNNHEFVGKTRRPSAIIIRHVIESNRHWINRTGRKYAPNRLIMAARNSVYPGTRSVWSKTIILAVSKNP